MSHHVLIGPSGKRAKTIRWRLPVVLALLLGHGSAGLTRAAERPNFIFILADDLGWCDLGCYGSAFYETPNLDRLAASGIRFTNAYAACCVCSPTRASILTGKYPARLQITNFIPGALRGKLNPAPYLHHLPLSEVTIAERLKEAGYTTASIGKWHLGQQGYWPEQQGFEVNIAGCDKGSPPSYFSPYKIPNLRDGPPGEYLTDRLTDEALGFIETARERKLPFFLYLAHYAVHNPQQAKPDVVKKYREKAARQPAVTASEFLPEGDRQARQIQDQPVYAAMVESLDASVGRMLATLERLSLRDNTVVFFTSDNGGLSTSEGSPTSNVPLRAGKGWPYEGGVREPLIVSWPNMIKAGRVSREPMISTDYYPTMLEMAGLPLEPGQHVDGVSLLPVLRGGTRPERALFWHYPHYSNQGGRPSGAILLGDYKLIEWFEDGRTELYNLRVDPGEKQDIGGKQAETAAELRRRLSEWRAGVGAKMPTVNPDYRRD
jgi:arylsulfatase A-like enzyme